MDLNDVVDEVKRTRDVVQSLRDSIGALLFGQESMTKISDDHEKRLRRLERLTYVGIGALWILELVLHLVKIL